MIANFFFFFFPIQLHIKYNDSVEEVVWFPPPKYPEDNMHELKKRAAEQLGITAVNEYALMLNDEEIDGDIPV
jgi:hypothetical protein